MLLSSVRVEPLHQQDHVPPKHHLRVLSPPSQDTIAVGRLAQQTLLDEEACRLTQGRVAAPRNATRLGHGIIVACGHFKQKCHAAG